MSSPVEQFEIKKIIPFEFNGTDFVEEKLGSALVELTIGKLMPSEYKIYLLNK